MADSIGCVDVRIVDNRLIRAAADRLKRFNDRHPWSHNDHFHRWILTRLPERRISAVDIGCGRGGLLARLSPEFATVLGTDTDPCMRRTAMSRCANLPNVRIEAADLAEVAGSYDLVTMVASFHHLDADDALASVKRILSPGGRFLVIGLAPPVGLRDTFWDLASVLTNPVIGVIKHPRVSRSGPAGPPFPVKDPVLTFDEIRELTDSAMPGSRMRHHLGFRYTLEWTKPGP